MNATAEDEGDKGAVVREFSLRPVHELSTVVLSSLVDCVMIGRREIL
eukprot:CAMPEP_0182583068 /NCGR_PEP_ID=MMETSP1324-20130603/54219_1 /TAXON_ID=236786 /ORGANISM="Florenciella sp., Strain RCC1587" /LENGTH=46 /DNA_ID= /DNA_START= /DNA_END= /DNA_ORIENTATION=